MKLRTQLMLAFSVLAVVPLGALTLYSYSSSIRAYRQAVQDEATLRAEEMQGRMAMVREDLDRRMEHARALPLFQLGGFGITIDSARADQAYGELIDAVGDFAPFLDRLAIRTGLPDGSLPAGRPSVASSGTDSVLIYLPGMASLPGMETLRPLTHAENVESAAADIHKFVMVGRHILPHVTLRAGSLGDFQTDEIERIVGVMAEAGEAVDVRRIMELSARMGNEILQWRHVIGAATPAPPAPGAVRQTPPPAPPTVIARDYPMADEGRLIGTVRADLNVGAVMNRVLPPSRRREGETPFAIDGQGHLYASSDSERTVLDQLGLTPGQYSGAAARDREWVVVSADDTASGLTFGIARPVGEGLAEIRRTAARNLALGLGMIAVAMVGIVQLSKRMTANLAVLTTGAQHLATGHLEHRVPITSKDEFGALAQTFNMMAGQLGEHQHRLVEQERLERELELCRQIQAQMLPKAPLCLPFAEIRGVSVPARQVGGDFFNFFPLPDGRVAVLVGDVSGKGVAAALLMANMQASLSARLPLAGSLAELAEQFDAEIFHSTPEGTFLTLFIGLIDHDAMTLRWLNAGHDAPYLIRTAGDLVPLASTGRPLGILPGGDFGEGAVSILPGDSLFLYTDGLVEAFSHGGEEFGTIRLEEILSRAGGAPLELILSEVDAAARAHRGDVEAQDDTTMVAVRMV
ncbi:SpoIIE family protein phosphatase [Candidatus Fermentibacteria bacterium]|nr:SpoIIE family protein phosphatase [Candidatus Fermentibacteria bacterium]